MKALVVLLCLCGATSSLCAQDPYDIALNALSQEHVAVPSDVPALTLDEAERIALQANPEIRVASRKVAVAEAQLPAAGALDDPSLMLRAWQVPLRQPWNYSDAQNMFMVGQSFPGPGKRALRSQIASDETSVAQSELAAVKLKVAAQVRRAFYDLLRNADEMKVHDEQEAIARQAFEAACIKYSVGKAPQQDVLKGQVALTKLIEHLVMLEQDAELSRSELNALLGRSPDTPVRVAGQYSPPKRLPSLPEMEQLALANRPELLAAQARIRQAEDQSKLAGKAYVPDFSVSAGYMLMPAGSAMRNNYMLEGSVSLPWLNRRKHEAEIAASQAALSEEQAAFDAARLDVFREIQNALMRAAATKKLVDLYQNLLRPQTEATLHATVIAYENDRTDILNLLDSQNATLDVDYSYFRALAQLEAEMSDLELAVGAPLPRDTGEQTKPEAR